MRSIQFGFPIETTDREGVIVLRIIQARLIAAKDKSCGGMYPAVLGMQDGFFRCEDWSIIFGKWIKAIELTDKEYDKLMAFCFHKGMNIVSFALVARASGRNDVCKHWLKMVDAWNYLSGEKRLPEPRRSERIEEQAQKRLLHEIYLYDAYRRFADLEFPVYPEEHPDLLKEVYERYGNVTVTKMLVNDMINHV